MAHFMAGEAVALRMYRSGITPSSRKDRVGLTFNEPQSP